MSERPLGQLVLGVVVAGLGALWLTQSLAAKEDYDLRADLRQTFLNPRFNRTPLYEDQTPRRVAPAMLLVFGLVLLLLALVRLLWPSLLAGEG